MRSCFGNGSGRSKTASTSENIATLIPIPSAKIPAAGQYARWFRQTVLTVSRNGRIITNQRTRSARATQVTVRARLPDLRENEEVLMKHSDFSPGGRSILSETRDAISDYRRLLNALGSRARRMGSRDPESAAQETLKRSLENTLSQPAIEYYFSEELPVDAAAPAWPLDQLMAWLHGVLRRSEERRVGKECR